MQYDFSLLAGEARQYEVKGRFIKYKAGTGMIRVRMSKGGYVDLLPGQGVRDVDFENFIITDKSGAANSGVVLAGDYAFQDDRITGTVDVVDGGKARTVGNIACMGYGFCPALASNYAYIQLFNPAGSGRNVFVGQVSFYSSGTVVSGVAMGAYNVALTALVRNGVRKNLAAGSSLMEVRSKNDTVSLIGTLMGAMDKMLKSQKLLEPIMIPPGFGLVIQNSTLAEDIGATFEYFEELL